MAGAIGHAQQIPTASLTLATLIARTVPVGVVLPFALATIPTGWLLCNGQGVTASNSLLRAALIAASSPYGTDGSGNPRVPDLRGNVPVGLDGAQAEFDALGEAGGAKTHTLSVSEMPIHDHTYHVEGTSDIDHIHDDATHAASGPNPQSGSGGNPNTGPAGNGDPHNNLQPYITLNFIIKA